ncbi:MAG: 23S rRNA (cytidine(2498)-2'-O)-methyltransferase RlmM [Pseudobacteriovorax sp.]|nr:23S rRNA (cytidine(2498)-2'-O)-methyltransferase RlmM [Pseudobacteriovorax sp.]
MDHEFLIQCRQGFEKDLAAELAAWGSKKNFASFTRTVEDKGYVFFKGSAFPFPLQESVFARQMMKVSETLSSLPEKNKLDPILEAIEKDQSFQGVLCESLLVNGPKGIQDFSKKFERVLEKALHTSGQISRDPQLPTLHVFFLDYEQAVVGCGLKNYCSRERNGILRLRRSSDAPSRSSLKLEEAFRILFPEHKLEKHENSESLPIAVDLGAAPGGWTYELVKRNYLVYSVDNGPMNPKLMQSGRVSHEATDAFHYRPPEKVDLLVCDIVEKPYQVSELIAKWFANNWTRRAIFNLKLPMKKRYAAVKDCIELLTQDLDCTVRCKQLFHDREEVTLFVESRHEVTGRRTK